MSKKDDILCLLMIQTIDKIFEYTSEFINADEFVKDEKSFDAVLMNFISLGETSLKFTENFRTVNNFISWHKIQAFRNIIAHNYFGVDEYEVWEIIKHHLLKLKNDLESI